MIKLITTLFLFFVSAVTLPAQTSEIRGSVKDQATGEELIGVNITIKGTYYGAATDFEGNYSIKNIKPGEYTLQASYVGYKRMIFTGIKVSADKPTNLDIKMAVEELTLEQEVVVVGEKPIFDIEQANSAVQVKAEDLAASPLKDIQQVVGNQAGIVQTVDGIYIRGGKPNETGFYVDGISAKDPLAGTGFGLDLNLNDVEELDVVTGGLGAESGAASGYISVKTKEGDNTTKFKVYHERDYFGEGRNDQQWSWNTDKYEMTVSGPVYFFDALELGDLTFYANGTYFGTDDFTKNPANQLQSSLFQDNSDVLAGKQDNRWSGVFKLTWKPSPTQKFFGSYRRSVNINQNANMLRFVTLTNDIRPGYQYSYSLNPDNGATYTADLNQVILGYTQTIDKESFIDFRMARLFSKLRADANGRPWRPDSLTEDYNPESIITSPISYWTGSTPEIIYVVQGDPYTAGLINKGISPTWHDHWAEEYTFKSDYTFLGNNSTVNAGLEHIFSVYNWVDINSPWIGAPIREGLPSTQFGYSGEIWKARPYNGGAYISYRVNNKGFIGSIGLRMAYFNPGQWADDLIFNKGTGLPIADQFVKKYKDETIDLLGNRMWLRALPKVKVSFPVSDNQMLFFNYGHSVSWPQAYQLYSRLDETDVNKLRSATRGNPTLKPETTVEYELGIRNQLTANDALTVVAFTKDKFDYITTTGDQEISYQNRYYYTYKNDDYAKILGIEASYISRLTKSLRMNVSASYQQASAKSSDFSDFSARIRDEITTKEIFLPWDRPWMFKLGVTYSSPTDANTWYEEIYSNWVINVNSSLQSGKRYDKLTYTGIDATSGLASYRVNPEDRFSKIADWWFFTDLGAKRSFRFGPANLAVNVKITNLFDNKNSTIINPLTGKAYELGDPFPTGDPANPNPFVSIANPFNPARYLPQRHIVFGVSLEL